MQRFHLSFHYWNVGRKHKNSGSTVIIADDLESAAQQIMESRDLKSIHIEERHHANGQVDTIDRTFKL